MIRLVVVALACVGLILFAAFVVARLLATRGRGVSVRMQVFFALSLIVGAFSAGLGTMVVDRIEARAVRLAQQAATDEATALSGMLGGELLRSGSSLKGVARRLAQERQRGAVLEFELLDQAGQRLFPIGAGPIPARDGNVQVSVPVHVSGQVVGQVRVTRATVVVRRLLADFAPTVLVISLVLGAAAAISAALIGRAIAQPIEKLTTFAERVSEGQRSAAVPTVVGGREVTRLARALSSMRSQLEGRPFVEAFAADLSHELKNPVAAIRASAEVLEEGALEEPEQARRFVRRIREATDRIEHLLKDLLALARIEARGVEDLCLVDLRVAIQTALGNHPEVGARCRFEGVESAQVRGDATWLAHAVENLLLNALVHSADGSEIVLGLERKPGKISFSVTNQGEVPVRIRDSLFRRFVTTRQDRGGSGLGLAIVRAVVEAHGGQARLIQAGPPQVVIGFDLPTDPSSPAVRPLV